jgi:isoleucyl-tRNA synthetase
VWFDSGTTHWHVLRGSHPMATPPARADLYLEGSDQHRGWFHSSLLTGCAIDGHAPYRAADPRLHRGRVRPQDVQVAGQRDRAAEGQRHLGADILRLWVASTDYSGEMAVSEQILQRSADAYASATPRASCSPT